MGRVLGWTVRHPYRGAVLVGIVVAVVFGWVSFPREKTIEKTIAGWLPENIAPAGRPRTRLLDDLASYREGGGEKLVKVSEQEFRDLDLAETYAYPAPADNDRDFRIQYIGRPPASEKLYVAERTVSSAPWWSPDRWVYRALEAEAESFGDVLRLTYERDLTGLIALLVMDVVVGGLYAAIAGMIFAVLGGEGLDRRQLPKPAPTVPIDPRGIFRA